MDNRNLGVNLPELAVLTTVASKPIDLELGLLVHLVCIKLVFPASSLLWTLNGSKYRKPHEKSFLRVCLAGSHIQIKLFALVDC